MTMMHGPRAGAGPQASDPGQETSIRWEPTPLFRTLSLLALLSLAASVIVGRAELLIVAGPLLWWLAAAPRSHPGGLAVDVEADTYRCSEGDSILITLTLSADDDLDVVSAALPLPPRTLVIKRPAAPRPAAREHRLQWCLRPGQWGRWTVGPATLCVRAPGGFHQVRLACPAVELTVLPLPVVVARGPQPASLPRRTGGHPAHAAGDGTEFDGLRPYQPGDHPRQVNWAASARRQSLFVTTRRDERSFDLILLLDAFLRVGPVGRDSLDVSVRAASGLARAHLRAGDRVGVVAVGGRLRGLAPGIGDHQLQRIADAVLDVRLDDSYVDPDVSRLPRTVLPPGALAVLFSPMLDERARMTALELRRRRHPVVIVDVLSAEPAVVRRDRMGQLAVRWWHLDREADRFELGRWGIPVLPWQGTTSLDETFVPLLRRPVGVGGRTP